MIIARMGVMAVTMIAMPMIVVTAMAMIAMTVAAVVVMTMLLVTMAAMAVIIVAMASMIVIPMCGLAMPMRRLFCSGRSQERCDQRGIVLQLGILVTARDPVGMRRRTGEQCAIDHREHRRDRRQDDGMRWEEGKEGRVISSLRVVQSLEQARNFRRPDQKVDNRTRSSDGRHAGAQQNDDDAECAAMAQRPGA